MSKCPSYAHLHVDGSTQRVDGTFVRTPPKSNRGRRWIPIPASAVAMLRRHRIEQNERRLVLGTWHDADLVFEDGTGNPVDPALFGKVFRAAARRAKVTGYTFHSLRHYFVTEAVNSGTDPATVSRIAGHATVAFTLQVYFHPSEETAAPLAVSVDATLRGMLNAL